MMKRERRAAETPLSAAQVLRRLAAIERDGVAFYQGLLQGTTSEPVRKLAAMMVRAETRHEKRFLEYAQRAEAAGPEGNTLTSPLPNDVARLLSVPVFVPRDRVRKSAPFAKDIEVIRVAIRAEESLALLLTQLRAHVPRAQRAYVTRAINEEWRHKAELEELVKKHFT